MSNQPRNYFPGGVYHIYNRGSDKRTIFHGDQDYWRFLRTLVYYQQVHTPQRLSIYNFKIEERKPPLLFNILAYCLMPNHFHLLLEARDEKGIAIGMSKLQNSYTRFYNTKIKRIGPLFQGRYKVANILSNEQLLHVARYIMLNPVTSKLVKQSEYYRWSSYKEFLGQSKVEICHKSIILDQLGSHHRLRDFMEDYIEYAQTLHEIKKVVIEEI